MRSHGRNPEPLSRSGGKKPSQLFAKEVMPIEHTAGTPLIQSPMCMPTTRRKRVKKAAFVFATLLFTVVALTSKAQGQPLNINQVLEPTKIMLEFGVNNFTNTGEMNVGTSVFGNLVQMERDKCGCPLEGTINQTVKGGDISNWTQLNQFTTSGTLNISAALAANAVIITNQQPPQPPAP
jgi:hypothetical protein